MTDASTIQDVVAGFQSQLETAETGVLNSMVGSYQRVYTRLEAQQAALFADIEQMRKAGTPITKAMIRKQARYKDLITQTAEQMQAYGAVLDDRLATEAPGAVRTGFDMAEALVQQRLQGLPPDAISSIMGSFNRMPREAVEALAGALQDNSPLRDLFATFGADTAQGISDTLLTALVSGKNPADAARIMTKAWGLPLTRSMSIARTEMLRAHRMATLASYRANPHIVKGWQWHANLDARTCMSCVAKHGEIFPTSETMDDHIQGRCSMIPVTPSWSELGFTDMPETGLDLQAGDGERWFRNQSEATQLAMMKPGKFEAWKAGKFELSQLSKAVTHDRWGRMFVETPLQDLMGEA